MSRSTKDNHLNKQFKAHMSNAWVNVQNFQNPSTIIRASDFFQDWWAKVTHGAKIGGSFSEMMGPLLIIL